MGEKAVISAIKKLEEAIGQFDRASTRPQLEQAETQRGEILQRFPRDHWPEMTLEEYALGQENSEDTFCRWMEFRSQDLGSMRGGSARKLRLLLSNFAVLSLRHLNEPSRSPKIWRQRSFSVSGGFAG